MEDEDVIEEFEEVGVEDEDVVEEFEEVGVLLMADWMVISDFFF